MPFILYIYASSFIIFYVFSIRWSISVLNDPLHLLKNNKKNDPLIEMEKFCISRYDFMLALGENMWVSYYHKSRVRILQVKQYLNFKSISSTLGLWQIGMTFFTQILALVLRSLFHNELLDQKIPLILLDLIVKHNMELS